MDQPKNSGKWMGIGFAIGLIFGTAFGVVFGIVTDNVPMGIALGPSIGVAIGISLGIILQSKKNENAELNPNEPELEMRKPSRILIALIILGIFFFASLAAVLLLK